MYIGPYLFLAGIHPTPRSDKSRDAAPILHGTALTTGNVFVMTSMISPDLGLLKRMRSAIFARPRTETIAIMGFSPETMWTVGGHQQVTPTSNDSRLLKSNSFILPHRFPALASTTTGTERFTTFSMMGTIQFTNEGISRSSHSVNISS